MKLGDHRSPYLVFAARSLVVRAVIVVHLELVVLRRPDQPLLHGREHQLAIAVPQSALNQASTAP